MELLTAQFVIINRSFPSLSFDLRDLLNKLWKKWHSCYLDRWVSGIALLDIRQSSLWRTIGISKCLYLFSST